MNTTRVLLIDDDEEDYLITRDLFSEIKGERKYRLDWVSTYEEGLKVIAERRHDAYLVDFRLGPHSGLDLIRAVCNGSCPVPFILLTGISGTDIDEQAMSAGAADFLVKGTVSPGELERTIRYNIRNVSQVAEIRTLNGELEKRVEERTAELASAVKELEQTNETLKKAIVERERAEKKAMEALEKEKMLNELKSRFVTMASHEFRTPLSTILTSIHLLARYDETQDRANREKHLNRIKGNIAQLTDLLNDFLSLEKLEAGKVTSQPESFNYHELVHSTVEEMQAIAKDGQKIVYVHENKGGPQNVYLDKRQVKAILVNLLSNAIKYSPENSSVNVKTESLPERSTIEVQDHGIGIPESEQAHLFERFFRAKNAVNIQGTGLGLNIIRKYLDLMGGQISFKSNVDEGTRFSVSLPNQFA